jgi:hypothetical protein
MTFEEKLATPTGKLPDSSVDIGCQTQTVKITHAKAKPDLFT